MSSERMKETIDYQLGVDGRLMKGEYKRLSLEEEASTYVTNAQLIHAKKMRARADKEEDLVEKQRNVDADSVLNQIEEEKAKMAVIRRKQIEEENRQIIMK